MDRKLWEKLGFWAMGLLLFVATMIIISWLVDFVTWSTLDSGWAQAIGSVAAILASFFLFQRQRKHEQQQGRDDELSRRTQAVAALQDVCFWALAAMEECVEHKKGMRGRRPEEDLPPRLDELRELLNRFVDPAADRIAILTAMSMGNALLQTKRDLPSPYLDRDDAGISIMEDRNVEMGLMHGRLIAMQHALEQKCAARGIVLDPAQDSIE
jgi:hypothetical protein